ncbi:MAG: phosphoribosylglycinamide formyltransferase [Methanoregula sp.]|jgi:phosphoribosylglycinamide formyltransferase-1
MTKRIVVVASGRGSNFQAIIESLRKGSIKGECVSLVTDNPKAYAIERAESAKVPVVVVDYAAFASRELYEAALLAALKNTAPDLVVLAGYMRILGSAIVREYAGKMINIHPALLPSFTGLHAQRQALLHGVKVAGCTVHFVDESLDGGPIILQRCVRVLDDDDEDTLANRILIQEHLALPEAVRLFCEDQLKIEGRKVRTGQ